MKYNAVHDHVVGIDLALMDLIRQCHDLDIHAQDPVDRPTVVGGAVGSRGSSHDGGVGRIGGSCGGLGVSS